MSFLQGCTVVTPFEFFPISFFSLDFHDFCFLFMFCMISPFLHGVHMLIFGLAGFCACPDFMRLFADDVA